jgi:hypothetical protein
MNFKTKFLIQTLISYPKAKSLSLTFKINILIQTLNSNP